jgi:hypothetical protein
MWDARLARQVIDDEPGDGTAAALTLFERNGPDSLAQATALVSAAGPLTDGALDRVRHAWDLYRHLRDSPCD